jgi:hypothetical protein
MPAQTKKAIGLFVVVGCFSVACSRECSPDTPDCFPDVPICSPDLPEPEQYWCTECSKPEPWEKYCTMGVFEDMDRRHFFMSSRCLNGKWKCCHYDFAPKDPEEFMIWYEMAKPDSWCPMRKPWEEVCVYPSLGPCAFEPSDRCGYCGNYNVHAPPPPEFEEWERQCLLFGCQ